MINPLDLTGKTVMITGASKGIGKATAIYLSRLGARIVAVARDREQLARTLSLAEGGATMYPPSPRMSIFAPWMLADWPMGAPPSAGQRER